MPKYLVRLIFLFLFGAATVITVRSLVVPKSFWMYGHYRGKALGEITAQQPRYAGRQACADCHGDLVDMQEFRHARVPCETCHGPAREHAKSDEPETKKPSKDIKRDFCLHCHEKDIARPADQPQVARDARVHKDGEADCRKCHTIHKPTPKTHRAAVGSPAPSASPASSQLPETPAASPTPATPAMSPAASPGPAESPVPTVPAASPTVSTSPGPGTSPVPGGKDTP